jgi:CRP-like cAMP-binding protein
MTKAIYVPIVREALRDEPKTNAELAERLGLLSYEVASLMGRLRQRGTVERTLGRRRRATYHWVGA